MTTPVLEVKDLRVHFAIDEGVVRAVDGVSFAVEPGQMIGIVGESRCGKSVTLKAVLQIVEPPGRIVGGQILWRRDACPFATDACRTERPVLREIAGGRLVRCHRAEELTLIGADDVDARGEHR